VLLATLIMVVMKT